MLERCEFCELNEDLLRECGGFSCKDEDITEFFTKEYADYAYQLLGKFYCFVEQEERRIVGAFTVANSSIRADLLPNSHRNKLNRNIPNEKRRPQHPAVLVGQLAVSEDYKASRRRRIAGRHQVVVHRAAEQDGMPPCGGGRAEQPEDL